jgi:hypothetical protein
MMELINNQDTEGAEEEYEKRREILREYLGDIIHWPVKALDCNRTPAGKMKALTIRMLAALHCLNPQTLQNHSLRSIARKLGISQAAISIRVKEFELQFGYKDPSSIAREPSRRGYPRNS